MNFPITWTSSGVSKSAQGSCGISILSDAWHLTGTFQVHDPEKPVVVSKLTLLWEGNCVRKPSKISFFPNVSMILKCFHHICYPCHFLVHKIFKFCKENLMVWETRSGYRTTSQGCLVPCTWIPPMEICGPPSSFSSLFVQSLYRLVKSNWEVITILKFSLELILFSTPRLVSFVLQSITEKNKFFFHICI